MAEYIQRPTAGEASPTKQSGKVQQDGTANAQKRQPETFTSSDGTRDYRALFRDVYGYLRKYLPPVIDDKGKPGGYWWSAGMELLELEVKYKNDKFANALIVAVFNELERESKAQRRIESDQEQETKRGPPMQD